MNEIEIVGPTNLTSHFFSCIIFLALYHCKVKSASPPNLNWLRVMCTPEIFTSSRGLENEANHFWWDFVIESVNYSYHNIISPWFGLKIMFDGQNRTDPLRK